MGRNSSVTSGSPHSAIAYHLRQTLVYLNMPVTQQPEAYIGVARICLMTRAR